MTIGRGPSRLFRVLVLSILAVAAVFFYFSPACSQQRVMRAAQAHIDVHLSPLTADARFGSVTFFSSTAEQIWVRGTLASKADFEALRRGVLATHPPVPVRWMLEGPDGGWDMLDDPRKPMNP